MSSAAQPLLHMRSFCRWTRSFLTSTRWHSCSTRIRASGGWGNEGVEDVWSPAGAAPTPPPWEAVPPTLHGSLPPSLYSKLFLSSSFSALRCIPCHLLYPRTASKIALASLPCRHCKYLPNHRAIVLPKERRDVDIYVVLADDTLCPASVDSNPPAPVRN